MKPYVTHVEFGVTNLKRAARFYRALFGFKVRIMPGMGYALWETKRQPGGGFALVKGKRVRHGGTSVVFKVDDIDAYLRKAKKLGAKIVKEKTVIMGGFGYFGAFRDPFGNVIQVYNTR
jgi:predicted enzyme related to lactoylglutathione lyase